MQYGYFDDAQREYVITNPKTPVKWINYVGTLAFGGLVDHTGGALICKGDPALNRITKYIPQLPASAFKGETLYLRIHDGDDYTIFSPYFVPTLDDYDRYECHVGMGYTRIVSEFYGIRTEVTIFVPHGEARLVRDIRVTNIAGAPRTVDAVPVVEYSHFDALKQFTNADWIPQTMQSMAHDHNERLVLTQTPFMNRDRQVNYLSCNLPVDSFETDRKRFLGANEYGTWADPLSLHEPSLGNYEALRGDNIGALLVPLGELAPGESRRVITQLGQVARLDEATLADIEQFWNEVVVDTAFTALEAFWHSYLATLQVETPNASMDSMLNAHHPRQCYITKNWSRYLSLYQLGLGARGMGFRDSAQDVMSVIAHIPDEAKALLTQLLHTQLRSGCAMHQFNPLSMEATMGDARSEPDHPQYYSDDHLWAILAIAAYIKETGDVAFLDHEIPFYDKDRQDQPIETGSVMEHIRRGIAFTRGHVGAHGLPLAGFADWNDTVNLPKGAESLFTASLYGRALSELIELAAFMGDDARADEYTAYYDEMRERVNQYAWDGAWYIRYFDAQGQPIGSHTNTAGQIFTNAQSWPVLAGFAPEERARQALDAVNRRLNTAHGIKLSMPGYDHYDPAIGGVSTYPPGAKENGGIFLHANPWVIIAETLLGNGDRAFQYYAQINPAAKNDMIDLYEVEPYVYAQNILGDEHPQFGLGRNSWLSGTASWMYQAATQWILGIRPTYGGLRVDPCIPQRWDGFTVTRQFRGATYHIQVSNPQHVNRGVHRLEVNGEPVAGDIVPVLAPGQAHTVHVTLG